LIFVHSTNSRLSKHKLGKKLGNEFIVKLA